MHTKQWGSEQRQSNLSFPFTSTDFLGCIYIVKECRNHSFGCSFSQISDRDWNLFTWAKSKAGFAGISLQRQNLPCHTAIYHETEGHRKACLGLPFHAIYSFHLEIYPLCSAVKCNSADSWDARHTNPLYYLIKSGPLETGAKRMRQKGNIHFPGNKPQLANWVILLSRLTQKCTLNARIQLGQ